MGGEVYTTLGRHLPRQTHPPRDGHCSGRYTSYWNAFLLSICDHHRELMHIAEILLSLIRKYTLNLSESFQVTSCSRILWQSPMSERFMNFNLSCLNTLCSWKIAKLLFKESWWTVLRLVRYKHFFNCKMRENELSGQFDIRMRAWSDHIIVSLVWWRYILWRRC